MEDRNIAIAHGHYTSQGGAERVATELARTFDAPIYACRVDPDAVPPDIEAHQVFNGRLARFFQSKGRKPATMYWITKHLYSMIQGTWVPELHEYDTVIISKNEMAWYVPRDGQTIVQYLHSPERAHYDQFYRRGASAKHRLWSFGYRTAMEQRVIPHRVICNSETVAERARLAYSVPEDRLDVCYPPVHTRQYSPDLAPDGEYYLSLARLYPNKRTGEIVEAFQGRDEELRVAGWGPERAELEEMADGHENIDILGFVEEHEKRELLAGAKAMVMNAENEDFGIAPIEAFASGTPVIGVDEPYTCHQIIDGENGVLYDRCELEAAVERFEADGGVEWSSEQLTGFAERFSADRFREAMRRHVAAAQEKAEVSPPWKDTREDSVTVEPVVDEAVTDGGERE